MAERETITGKVFDSGRLVADFTGPCWNIHNLVGDAGSGGINATGDVMVIQTMLYHIAVSPVPVFDIFRRKISLLFGSFSVNGIFDSATSNIIKSYQEFRSDTLIAVDGLIHPADYKGRTITIKWGSPVHLMTITQLHLDCVQGHRSVGGKDYTIDFKLFHPKLHSHV